MSNCSQLVRFDSLEQFPLFVFLKVKNPRHAVIRDICVLRPIFNRFLDASALLFERNRKLTNYNQTEIYLKNETIFCGAKINAIIVFVTPAMTRRLCVTYCDLACFRNLYYGLFKTEFDCLWVVVDVFEVVVDGC